PFNRLPSKRFYPDYYMEIKHPMSLAKIKAKIKNGAYKNSVDVVEDMNLMFDNAKRYNRPDSKIFKDAVRLQKVMHIKAKELFNYVSKETDSSESDNDDSMANLSNKKTATPKPKKSMSSAMTHELKKARRSQQDVDAHLKKRMKLIFKSLVDYVDDMGRPLITLFLEKPSIKDYPDYYHIIEKPIDMRTIEGNIKFDRYLSVDALVADFLLMFKNCKQYNEEGSQIYRDAETLELVLKRKLEELGPYVPAKPKRTKTKMNSSLQQKLKTLYDTVINYTDNKGNKLSHIFMKLPSRIDYPDYYEVTKKPIDLEKIGSKVRTGIYESPDDLLADLVLMFDNACKYNEPDSQIYKSALSLQHVALQTKLELTDTRGVPDVKAIVQDMLTNLFISVYNHQVAQSLYYHDLILFIRKDEEGRCYSDSLNELFEDIKPGDSESSVSLSLDTIKRNLDKGRYRRLDRFQQDMFEVFEAARKFSRTDSQAFEDSIELQTYFIRLRNDLCKNGENFISSALNYTEADLNAAVEMLKSEKLPLEQQEIDLDLDPKQREKEFEGSTSLSGPAESIDEVSLNNVVYRPLDFVLIEPREKSMEPHIIHIQKLWRDSSGEIWIYGCWFYRPNETFHIASKKFLEKEVFKSDNYNNTPLGQVVGKCIVMFVK
ncbi:Protein polybromo-1-like protein, partial [Leptotrombidium deliense]